MAPKKVEDAIEEIKKSRSRSLTITALTDSTNFEIWSEKLISNVNAACSGIDRDKKNRYINMFTRGNSTEDVDDDCYIIDEELHAALLRAIETCTRVD